MLKGRNVLKFFFLFPLIQVRTFLLSFTFSFFPSFFLTNVCFEAQQQQQQRELEKMTVRPQTCLARSHTRTHTQAHTRSHTRTHTRTLTGIGEPHPLLGRAWRGRDIRSELCEGNHGVSWVMTLQLKHLFWQKKKWNNCLTTNFGSITLSEN